MKIRFYVDVPDYYSEGFNLVAWQKPMGTTIHGMTRVAFDVEFPPDLVKRFDVAAQTSNVHKTILPEGE